MSGQNEQLVDATSCLFEQQKVAPGDKLRNVEHVQLCATCCPNNTTRPNRQQVARQQVACLDGALGIHIPLHSLQFSAIGLVGMLKLTVC